MCNFVLYTDGACLGNPGPGGWAYAFVVNGKEETSRVGGAPETTNNRMELMAVINGLSGLEKGCSLTVCSDSQYVINAFAKGWVEKWRASGWTRSGDELANRDLWQTLYLLARSYTIEWKWVKGHAGDRFNELCDQRASQAAREYADRARAHVPSEREDPAEPLAEAEPEQMALTEAAKPDDGEKESLKKLEGALTDTLFVLDMSLIHANKRDYGLETPCGACPWCDLCTEQMPQDGGYCCAKAYVAYHIAKREGKVNGRVG